MVGLFNDRAEGRESRVPCYLDYNWPAASVVNFSLRQNGIGSLFVNEYIKIHPVSSSAA